MRDWKENLQHMDVMRNILSETGNKIVNKKNQKKKEKIVYVASYTISTTRWFISAKM